MRTIPALIMIVSKAACQRSPDQQQADTLRNDAQQRGSTIQSEAGTQADRLMQQAKALEIEAKQSGGFTGAAQVARRNSAWSLARPMEDKAG